MRRPHHHPHRLKTLVNTADKRDPTYEARRTQHGARPASNPRLSRQEPTSRQVKRRSSTYTRYSGATVSGSERMAELRRARVEDVRDIMAIDPRTPSRPEEIQAMVGEQTSLVAVENGQIVGFLGLRPGHFYGYDFVDLLLVATHRRRARARARSDAGSPVQHVNTPSVHIYQRVQHADEVSASLRRMEPQRSAQRTPRE